MDGTVEEKNKTIARLMEENAMLRERVSQFETMHAISVARVPPHTVLSALEEEREYLEQSLQPVRFKRSADVPYVELPTYPMRPHFEKAAEHPSTQVVVFDGCPNDPYHPSSTPIYQTATFVQPDICEFGPYDYSRSGNPTRTALETLMAKLEGAHSAFAFASGMAALQTVIATLEAGSVVLASSDLYGGMYRLLTQVTSRMGIEVVFVETWNLEAVKEKMTERVKLLHLECPTNPLVRIVDIKALCEMAHSCGVMVSIDNTMMSPVRCTPISLGCDYVIHSATKFLCGHSDTMCGIVCVKNAQLAKRVAFLQNAQGNSLSPFDSWLLLRGLKTLAIRVEKQELNAVAVALFLSQQTHVVKRLHYAGINPTLCPEVSSLTKREFEIHRSQTTGPGSVISLETGDLERSYRFVRALKLFKLTVSFGSCNSVVELPCLLSHASIPLEEQTLPRDIIRLSIGIEQIEDILGDLGRAIDAVAHDTSPAVNDTRGTC
ncbi:cystathionine beta-lyase-like protein [Trypanosoma grayi]|uniref:cystathionine beta-lyase-like protein n=1 Tax=Trypanosoma grayi TaxID=71804 RepID=UPI0004F4BA28|nr:cystathionine beta-lyase-like protein [Trypanosoma grayi]KEG09956.1 cystathionine beta-lyase-like protein [Trypanosoma grayi]